MLRPDPVLCSDAPRHQDAIEPRSARAQPQPRLVSGQWPRYDAAHGLAGLGAIQM